jgi:hypothetical protein
LSTAADFIKDAAALMGEGVIVNNFTRGET